MAERKFAALAELRRRPEPPADNPPAPDTTENAPAVESPRLEPAPPPMEVLVAPEPSLQPPPPSAAPPPIAVAAPASVPVVPEPQRGRGRPPGKRSDPDWAPRTILMRSKIHRRVSIMLLERDDGPDLSELVDQLLTDWIAKQS